MAFNEFLSCTRHNSRSFVFHVILIILSQLTYYPHFTDKEVETPENQGGQQGIKNEELVVCDGESGEAGSVA